MCPILVTITGPIGAGKTTLLHSFSGNENVLCLEEAIDLWKMVQSTNLLEECTKYNRRCMEFQIHLITCINRSMNNVKDTLNEIILTDRGNEDPHRVFIPAMLYSNKIDTLQAEILSDASLTMSCGNKPQYYIYLRSSPQKCLERISARGRFEENEITENYIEMICSLYDQWLGSAENSFTIDVDNLTREQVYGKCLTVLNRIKSMHK